MVTHELFGKHLRLGNFLFKYAFSKYIEEKYGILTSYPDYYLWKYLKYPPIINTDNPQGNMIRPHHWHWSSLEQSRVESLLLGQKDTLSTFSLDFFFQSENWFKGDVKNWLEPKLEYLEYLKEKYKNYLSKETVGIGLRLGDFVGHGDFYQIPYNWYLDTLHKYFDWTNKNVVVFSDDIEKAKMIFKDYPFLYAEKNDTHTHAQNFKFYHNDAAEQFFLGTLMDNFIIGNSTFSWWQAKLCKSNNVIHSGKVFSAYGNMRNINTSDYYSKNWHEDSSGLQ